MEGIEKITAKIIQDSEAEVTRILEETERKARSIGEEAQAQAGASEIRRPDGAAQAGAGRQAGGAGRGI